jgi:hypothetical protein
VFLSLLEVVAIVAICLGVLLLAWHDLTKDDDLLPP